MILLSRPSELRVVFLASLTCWVNTGSPPSARTCHWGLGCATWKNIYVACLGCWQAAPLSSDSGAVKPTCMWMSGQSSLLHKSSVYVYGGTREGLCLWENITVLSRRGTLKDTHRIMAVSYRGNCHSWVEPLFFFTRTKAPLSQPEIGKIVVTKHQIGCCTSRKGELCLFFHQKAKEEFLNHSPEAWLP